MRNPELPALGRLASDCYVLVPMEDFEQRSGRQVVDWGGENKSEELWVRGAGTAVDGER